MRFASFGAAVGALLLVAGCAQPLKKQAYNQAASVHIKQVVLTRDPDQDRYEAVVLGHPAASFGLVGGLIAAADMQAKGTRLTEAIVPSETRLQGRFAELVQQRLTEAGYEPTVLLLPKDTKEADMTAAAQAAGAKGQAVLALRVAASYMAAGPSSDYFPSVRVKAVLTETPSGKTLYEDLFTYGYTMPQLESVHFASDATYRYANMDALVADPGAVREGLYKGLEAIAGQLIADLKRP